MAIAAQTPDILGERQSGQDVRTQNGKICSFISLIGCLSPFVGYKYVDILLPIDELGLMWWFYGGMGSDGMSSSG